MGNYSNYCNSSQHIEGLISRDFSIATFKQTLCMMTRSKNFESKHLQEFHHEKLPELIILHYKPRQTFKSKTHYETNFLLQQQQRFEIGQSSDAYTSIRQQLQDQSGSFFSFILNTYFKFLEDVFTGGIQNVSKPINPRCIFLPGTQVRKSKLTKSLKKTKPKYIEELTASFVLIMDMLKVCVLKECQKIVDALPKSDEYIQQNELILQRAIQYFVFMRGSPLVRELYRDFFSESVRLNPVENLEQSLVPIPYSLNNSQVFEHSFQKYSELTRRMSSPEQTIIMEEFEQTNKQILRASTVQNLSKQTATDESNNESIPYHQTFTVLNLMCQETKFWRIWRLIDSLDSLVVEVYLNQREPSELTEYLGHINAEDSKSEIIYFILNKYRQQNQQGLETLFCMVRFMYSHDSILHQKIKFIFSSAFLRFHTLLEMVVKGTK